MRNLLISFLENFNQQRHFQITKHKIGKKVLEEMNKNPLISKFQWIAVAGEEHNMLTVFSNHFVNSFFLVSSIFFLLSV